MLEKERQERAQAEHEKMLRMLQLKAGIQELQTRALAAEERHEQQVKNNLSHRPRRLQR